MKNTKGIFAPLDAKNREQFILYNQWPFQYGAMMKFGECDVSPDGDGEIISRKTTECCLDAPDSEHIV